MRLWTLKGHIVQDCPDRPKGRASLLMRAGDHEA